MNDINNTPQENRTKTLHLFCIGGSGLRALKSLLMLLASGVDFKEYTIKPHIVDPHVDSQEIAEIGDLIRRYTTIHNSEMTGFFRTPLSVDPASLNLMNTGDMLESTFGDFIGYPQMNGGSNEKHLVDLLYTPVNLEKSMSVGFKGSPNVGCVVFESFIESERFRNEIAAIGNDDAVVVIGSVFGGTGASGVPTIARAIKQRQPQCRLASILILPYFKLGKPREDDTNKEINSQNFETKALAALEYYKTINSENEEGPDIIDTFYLAGDSTSHIGDKVYKYDEARQGNKAHVIELFAVTAIDHFLSGQPLKRWHFPGVEKAEANMKYRNFGAPYNKYLLSLGDLYVFSKFFRLMQQEKRFPMRIRTKDKITQDEFQQLESFLYTNFIPWLGEITDNSRAFDAILCRDEIFQTEDLVTKERKCKFRPQLEFELFDETKKRNTTRRFITPIPFGISYYMLAVNNRYKKAAGEKTNISEFSRFVNASFEGIHKENRDQFTTSK